MTDAPLSSPFLLPLLIAAPPGDNQGGYSRERSVVTPYVVYSIGSAVVHSKRLRTMDN